MPIEFSCPACRQLVRTPDAAAGKKGRCPQCQAIVQIPAVLSTGKTPAPEKPAAQLTPAKSDAVESRAGQRPAPQGAIEFGCVWCGELVRTPASTAGKRGKCPHCGRVVTIPAENPRADAPVQGAAPMPAAKAVQRPAIKPVTPVPAATKPAAKKPAAPPNPGLGSLAPLEELPADSGLTPLPDDVGLTPLPELAVSSLTPLEGLTPLSGGPELELTPLPTTAPLPQAGDGLAVLAPLPDDPLAGLSEAGRPFAPAGLAPAQAYPAYSAPAAFAKPIISDARRRGLAWEREPSMDSFGETLKEVVTAPHDAFSAMRRGGGIVNPLGFLVVSYALGQMLILVEIFLFNLFWLLFFTAAAQGGQAAARLPWEAFFIGFGITAVFYMFTAVIAALVGGFIMAGIYHLALLMFGGAHAGFEATYRVVAFGTGAVYMLVPIPLIGPFFAFVMHFVVLIFGFKHAHETTGGRAALAVFGPALVALCCTCPLWLLFFGSSMSLLLPLLRR